MLPFTTNVAIVTLLALITSNVSHWPLDIDVVHPVITESLDRWELDSVGGALAVILAADVAGVEDTPLR
jgi:hypothetical protein